MKTFTETLQYLDEIARIDFNVSKKLGAERIPRSEIEGDIIIQKGEFHYGVTKDRGDVEAFVGKYNKHRKNEFVKLGSIDLERIGVNRYTVHLSQMSGAARGKGIGKGLYEFILTDLKYILVSGGEQSVGGRKAWKYLAGNTKYVVWAQPKLNSKKRSHVDIDPDDFEVDAHGYTVYGGDEIEAQLELDYTEALEALVDVRGNLSKTEYNKRRKKIHNEYEAELKDNAKGYDAYLFAVAKKYFHRK